METRSANPFPVIAGLIKAYANIYVLLLLGWLLLCLFCAFFPVPEPLFFFWRITLHTTQRFETLNHMPDWVRRLAFWLANSDRRPVPSWENRTFWHVWVSWAVLGWLWLVPGCLLAVMGSIWTAMKSPFIPSASPVPIAPPAVVASPYGSPNLAPAIAMADVGRKPRSFAINVWRALPGSRWSARARQMPSYQADQHLGERVARNGMVVTVLSLGAVIPGVIQGVSSPLLWVGAPVLLFGLVSFHAGSKLQDYGDDSERATKQHSQAFDEALILADAMRATKSLAEMHSEAEQLGINREHQRLLLELRQPHEIRLKAMEITVALTQIAIVVHSSDKFAQYVQVYDRLQATSDRIQTDLISRGYEKEELAERIAKIHEDLGSFAQVLSRQGLK